MLEKLQNDEDMQKYLRYLEGKHIPPYGDASKRGLAVHGNDYCQCSTIGDTESKRKFIYICTDCNIQKLWNHATGKANKMFDDTQLNQFAVQRLSWRIRAAIKTGQKAKSQSTESDVHGGIANLPQLSFDQQLNEFATLVSPDYSPYQLPATPQALGTGISPERQTAIDLFSEAANEYLTSHVYNETSHIETSPSTRGLLTYDKK